MGEEHARRIPTELEIKILQHIADEDEADHSCWSALVQCALVCKAWTEHVRRHLYYAINMNKLRGALQFNSLRQYAHLRCFVRDFVWPQTRSAWSLYCFTASDANDAGIIKEIAPSVMRLRFRRVNHWPLKEPLIEVISTFANITELDMVGTLWQSWTTAIRMISIFPALTTLAMPDVDYCQEDDPKVSYPPPIHLTNIKLAMGCETETVNWICMGSPIPSIQTVETRSQIDLNAVARLLRSLGGSLRHLVIHIDSESAFLPMSLVAKALFLLIILSRSRRGYPRRRRILLSPHRKHYP